MCVPGLHRDGARLAAWPIVALVALALVVTFSLRGTLTAWPDRDTMPAAFEAAIADLEQAVGNLPPGAPVAAGAPARVLLESAIATLALLDRSEVAVADPASGRDLVFAVDAIRTVAEIVRAGDEQQAGVAAAEIETLTREALVRLRRLDRRLAENARAAGDAIVQVEDRGDHWLIQRTDRGQHDLVRALGVALLLGGCLMIALRLLGRTRPAPTLRSLLARPTAVLGVAAFVVFLAGSLALVMRPSAMPGASTTVTRLPRPGPCSRLEVAREVFWASEQLEIGPLTERVRRRAEARARDCLGLDSTTAAHEATRPLLARHGSSDRGDGPVPAASPRSISLALVPEIRQDVAHLQTSIDTLLEEVARLRAERPTPVPSEPSSHEVEIGGPEIPAAAAATSPMQPDPGPVPTEADDHPDPPAAAGPQVAARAEPPAPAAEGPRPFVTTTAVNYRSGPSRSATKLGTLQEGTRVRLVADDDGWASVRLHDGRAVYVASAYLRPIE
jgi:hypothetical protein